MDKTSYKSFFWSIGTTSFRMKQFNKMVEEQLRILNEFWEKDDNKNLGWDAITQEKYYEFLKEQSFIKGDEKNKPKHAREKTSSLVDLGLIYENRRLTNVGKALLNISLKEDFAPDNDLLIEKDSFIYFKQLLKTSYKFDNSHIRPFILLLYILIKFKEISYEEFKYLLPLCIDKTSAENIIKSIGDIRQNYLSIDDVIIDRFMSLDNYLKAYDIFIKAKDINKDIITLIGINRKSKKYDEEYYNIYKFLKQIYIDKNYNNIQEFYNNLKLLRLSKYWLKHFFTSGRKKQVIFSDLKDNSFSKINNEKDLKDAFFKFMHLNKIKATLDDYFDLNKRYVGLSDIIIFQDNKITLDIIPYIYFTPTIDKLYNLLCFEKAQNLTDDISLENIETSLKLDKNILIKNYNKIYNKNIKSIDGIKEKYNLDRYKRFHNIIDNMFYKDKLLELLDNFKNRDDKKINQYVTINADIPTIFEYIIGIIWYEISGRVGDILSYMNLSLDADLLPKTHATGGIADIIYKYNENINYPAHDLLIEVTLTDKANQRRMEMEPVTRHLGQYLLKHRDKISYCVFITTYLDINVLNDFRHRKNMSYYDSNDNSQFIKGMKIIPLETDIIKIILEKEYNYARLYNIFEDLYLNEETDGQVWYNELKNKIMN